MTVAPPPPAPPPRAKARARAHAAGFAAFAIASALAMAMLIVAAPTRGDRVALVFPPWWGAGAVLRAIAAGDARLVRFGAVPWLAVVAPPPHGARRPHVPGALAALDPRIVGGCDSGAASFTGT